MITDNKNFWEEKAENKNWQEYILPGRTSDEFCEEGKLQVMEISKYIKKTDVVIDYGCGVGRMVPYIKELCKKVIGLDISSGYIKKAIVINNGKKGIKFGEVKDWNEKTDFADFIVCLMVMQHNSEQNRKTIINHIHALLKPGGVALISFPQKESTIYKETEFVHKFSAEEVISLASVFNKYDISTGNLVKYKGFTPITHNEYFLIAEK